MRGQVVPRTPSRFLIDVPKELCELHEVSELTKVDLSVMREKTQKAISSFATRPKF